MLSLTAIIASVKSLGALIPPHLIDWSKSEVLNLFREKIPVFFNYCKGKLSNFWGLVTNKKVKEAVDKVTSNFTDLNDKIPPDLKQRFFEHITGSKYRPDSNFNGASLSEIIQTDDEKKAAAMQMAYLVAILGGINQQQEHIISEYMKSLKISEKLKYEITVEIQEAEKELEHFVQEISQLDKEFNQISIDTAKAKKDADDIINLI
jgi:hypothetical protein